MAGYISDGIPYYYGSREGAVYLYDDTGANTGTGAGLSPVSGVTWVDAFQQVAENNFGATSPAAHQALEDPSVPLEGWSSYQIVDFA